MSDPSAELQKAIYAALTASAGVASAMGGTARVFDLVVPEPAYPFVRIGDDQALGDDTSCEAAWEVASTVHVFARGSTPRMDVKAIGAAARAALATELSVTGFRVVLAEFVSFRTYFETDGLTAHGVLELRYLIDPA